MHIDWHVKHFFLKDDQMEKLVSKRGREQGSLSFSESKIEITLKQDDLYEGYFEIECSDDGVMEGYIYSSSIRMQAGVRFISGNKIAVPYEFDSSGMNQGDVLKGNFMIVSSFGEYILPFAVSISHEVIESSLGSIRNLFHFTNLAKSDWDEAVRVFYSPGFIDIMTGTDASYRNLYMGLTSGGNKNHNLEEFLIGINKKKIIEYSVSQESFKITDVHERVSESFSLIKDGWGYVLVGVKAIGDFIVLPKNRLKSEDFDGDECVFEYGIDPDKLHSGNNFGRIVFKHLYGQIAVDITVSNTSQKRRSGALHREKNARYLLVRHYLDHRMDLISRNKWVTLCEDIVSHRGSIDSSDIENALYEAYLLLVQERFNEAKWILDRQIAPYIEEESDEFYCFYLYLTVLYNVDHFYTADIASRISAIYDKNPDNWRIAWVLLKTSDEFKRNPARMYDFALGLLSGGCNSPLVYIEIVKMLHAMPSLLTRFDDEELRVLNFAARNRLISLELREQIAYQAGRFKDYDIRIVRILKALYDSNPTDDVLQAICYQLIRGGRTGDKYYEFYAEGVKRGFGITRLYECYLESAGERTDVIIPREALMYFSYDNDLSAPQKAYLYAYIIKHKNEDPDIYMEYRATIERFTLSQLYAGRLNRDLAYLYTEIVLGQMPTEDNLTQFAGLLLIHQIRVEDPQVVSVIIMDERLKKERVYPVSGSKAYVVLPSSDYTLLLEDSLGNRYFGTKEYVTERFFLPRKMLPLVEPYAKDDLFLNLYICEGNKDFVSVNDRNHERYLYLEQSEEVDDGFKAAIRLPLVKYYRDADDTAMLDGLLERMERNDIPVKDRDELIRLLISRGLLDRAFEYVLYYGPESMEAQVLVRLSTMLIDRDGLIEDDRLTAVILSAFDRGKYNETGLLYLVTFYKGPAKNLRNIWKAASGFYVETYNICERMIEQTLKTGAYIGDEAQVLREYVEGGGRTALELEYLTYLAQEYFVGDRLMDEYFFGEMARIYENENELPTVCMLAFLKYYAYNAKLSELSDNTAEHIRRYIKKLYVQDGIIMPFMQSFASVSRESEEMSKLTVVEYRGEPGSRVTINYFISSENSSNYGYTRDEMKEIYGGIYTKSFLLFFGETLQYYVTEEHSGMEELTESGTANKNDVDSSDLADRFNLINDIAMASTLGDYDTALRLLEEYKEKEYITDRLFNIQ